MKLTQTMFVAALVAAVLAPEAAAQRRDQAPPFTPGWAGPQLEAQPDRGAPGTRVEIRGARFRAGARAFYGDRPMQIIARGERVIVAVIPRGARESDFIYVVDPSGRARTEVPFRLARDRRVPRDPRFGDPRFGDPRFGDPRFGDPRGRARAALDVRPARGEPGSRVLISGRRFAPDATPLYGDRRMRVIRRGDRFLVAEIPRGVRRDHYIYVVDRRGTFRTTRRFELFARDQRYLW